MDRRHFLGMAAKGAVGTVAAAGLAACQPGVLPAGQVQQAVAENSSLPSIDWQMATSASSSLNDRVIPYHKT